MLAQAEAVDMPDEQIIEIQESGAVFLNGREFDRAARTDKEQHELPELASTLVKYRLACTAAKTEAMVTISAADEVKHQRVIDVMNTCAMAGIKNVTFGAVTE
ncbi:MAG: biopolymer transporter ExbD, partial [Candidatus Nanoarchaeia archaeon]